jgi:hypothetical protein
MKTIETTITVLPDGSIQIPPRPDLPPGEHHAVLVVEETAVTPPDERERVAATLRAAGLLTELSPEEKARAARSTLTLEEARTILDRAGGKPLSEIVLDLRGPKE